MSGHNWRDDAACRGYDPEMWFPESSAQGRRDAELAKQICNTCPIRQACYDESVRLGDVYGIWGGRRIPIKNAYHRYRSPFRAEQPCGTMAAVRRHYRENRPLCNACRTAQNEHYRDRRKKARTA